LLRFFIGMWGLVTGCVQGHQGNSRAIGTGCGGSLPQGDETSHPAAFLRCGRTFVKTGGRLQRLSRLYFRSGGYLTSLDPRRVGAGHLGDLVRGHWSIENNLHWCLEVSFGDDAARVRKDHGPINLAAVKRLVLGLVKRSIPQASTPLKAKRTSLKTRRFLCSLDDTYLICTLTGGNR